jgi:hypothetical protein
MQEESERVSYTHSLSSAEEGQVRTPNEGQRERHSPPVDGRGKDKSINYCRTPKSASERGALTLCRAQRMGDVRTTNQGQQATGTHWHFLFSTDGRTSEDPERKLASDRHSPTVEHGGRYTSGRRNKASERRALTSCRVPVGDK